MTLARRFLKSKIGLALALASALLCASLLLLTTSSCGEEDCLVQGENCTASYKQSNYGTTDIWCCDGMICKTNVSAQVCKY